MQSNWSTCLRCSRSKRFREAGASIGQFRRCKDYGVVRLTIHETGAVIEGAGPRTTAFGQSCRSDAEAEWQHPVWSRLPVTKGRRCSDCSHHLLKLDARKLPFSIPVKPEIARVRYWLANDSVKKATTVDSRFIRVSSRRLTRLSRLAT